MIKIIKVDGLDVDVSHCYISIKIGSCDYTSCHISCLEAFIEPGVFFNAKPQETNIEPGLGPTAR